MAYLSGIIGRIAQKFRDDSEVRSLDKLQENDLAMDRHEIDSLVHARSGARDQLLKMAAKFGVSEHSIDKERWRALEIVHACNQCTQSKSCYQYLAGQKNVAFDPKSCPNAERYVELGK